MRFTEAKMFQVMFRSLFEVGDISIANFSNPRGDPSFCCAHAQVIDKEQKQTFAKIEENDTNVQVARSRVHGKDGI